MFLSKWSRRYRICRFPDDFVVAIVGSRDGMTERAMININSVYSPLPPPPQAQITLLKQNAAFIIMLQYMKWKNVLFCFLNRLVSTRDKKIARECKY
jgi:hypothetical protein